MRQFGSLQSTELARRFAAAVAVRGLAVEVRPEADGTAVLWVQDEDRLPTAREELDAFHADPQAARFHPPAVKKPRPQPEEAPPQPARSHHRVTLAIAAAAVAATLVTGFGKADTSLTADLAIAPFERDGDAFRWWPGEGLSALEQGQVWRLVTPALLHFDPFHILFNVLWLWMFGTAVEALRGPWRLLAFLLTAAAGSNLAEYWFNLGLGYDEAGFHSETALDPSPMFGGLSGVNFALFGLIWMRARLLPGSGFAMPRDTVVWMLLWLVACTSGLIGPVANVAHLSGLLIGLVIGAAPRLWRRTA